MLRKARKRIDAIPRREARLMPDDGTNMFASDWLAHVTAWQRVFFPP